MGVIDRVGPNVKNLKVGDVRPHSPASLRAPFYFSAQPSPSLFSLLHISITASCRLLPDRVSYAFFTQDEPEGLFDGSTSRSSRRADLSPSDASSLYLTP